jgi:hypothetical protein
MSKALRFTAAIPVSKAASRNSTYNQFVPIALFSGLGLLLSLVAIVGGVQGVWY